MAKTKLSFAIALVRRNSVPLVVLALSLLGVLWMWHDDRRAREGLAQEHLSGLARDLAANLAAEMRMHEQMLRGAAGLLESSSKVSRATFHSYVERLALQPRFPGILSVGYAEQLTGSAIGAFEHSIRGSDYAEFQIHPPGKRALYVPVIYVEPSTAQNRGITGYDMLSEPIRREAIERARDSGHIALSARVTLMQDRHAFAPEPGLLLYLPIYHREAPTNDVPQRRAAIKGFVYVALHSENLFVGALVDELKDMRVQVFDGTRADPSKLLFATPQAASADGIKARKTINAAGRT